MLYFSVKFDDTYLDVPKVLHKYVLTLTSDSDLELGLGILNPVCNTPFYYALSFCENSSNLLR